MQLRLRLTPGSYTIEVDDVGPETYPEIATVKVGEKTVVVSP